MNLCYSLLVMLTLLTSINAQTSVIKVGSGAMAFGVFNACYEQVVSPKGSLEISGSYLYKLFGVLLSSLGFGIGYKAYVSSKEPPKGFYIMPNVGYNRGRVQNGASFGNFNIGSLIGYQIIGNSGFTFDAGIGPSYTAFSGNTADAGFNRANGFLPQIRLAIGYAW